MKKLMEYKKFYPANDGIVAKQTQRMKHIIDEFNSKTIDNISPDIHDEFHVHLQKLNELSKKITRKK